MIDGHTINAATAASDPGMTVRIDSFFTNLKQLFDLDRGLVEFLPLDASVHAISDEVTWASAERATTAFSQGTGAQFIFTDQLNPYGDTLWGVTPWIPGTSIIAGHRMTAVVVDISLGVPAAADGMTMVHELGHFLGLFHTTESDHSYHDPLSDTPECAVGMTTCPDGHNIMFSSYYGMSGGFGLTTSPQQRRVVWGSPLYTRN